MRKVAAWVIGRRANSLVAVSGFSTLGFVLPPFLIMGLAVLGLVTMRRGGREGLLVLLGCVALLGAVALLLTQSVRLDLIVLVFLGLATWVIAMVYRLMLTPAWMINAVGIIGLVCVAGFYLVVADPEAFWQVFLDQYFRPLFVEQQLLQSRSDFDKLIAMLARILTGGMVAMICILLITSLLLARWWQAMLYNPGGFRREFYALRLGHVTASAMVALLVVSLFEKSALLTDMMTVFWLLFFFQGLAVMHNLVGVMGMGISWLVGLYLLILVVPSYASLVISGLGLVDSWFDFRRRLPKKAKPPGIAGK